MVGKALADVEAEALVGTFPDTLSEVVAKTNAEKTYLCGGQGTALKRS